MVGAVPGTRPDSGAKASDAPKKDEPKATSARGTKPRGARASGAATRAKATGKTSAKAPRAKATGARRTAKATGAKPARARRPARDGRTEEVARSYFAAVASRDPDAMAEHWHPEGIEDFVPLGIYRGPEEVRSLFRELFAAVPDMEMVVDRVTADEQGAAVQWRMSGNFTGTPFQGIEATGRRVDLRGADCLEIRDGKIVRNTVYYDGAEFARTIGLLPGRDSGAERAMLTAFNAATRLRHAVGERLAARQAAGR
jgi:steroid delta-isomerase-like uncharacterized protein